MTVHATFKYDVVKLKYQHLGFVLVFTFQLWDIAFESDALMHHVLNAAAQNYLLVHWSTILRIVQPKACKN